MDLVVDFRSYRCFASPHAMTSRPPRTMQPDPSPVRAYSRALASWASSRPRSAGVAVCHLGMGHSAAGSSAPLLARDPINAPRMATNAAPHRRAKLLRPRRPVRRADPREAGIRRACAGCSGALDAQRSIKRLRRNQRTARMDLSSRRVESTDERNGPFRSPRHPSPRPRPVATRGAREMRPASPRRGRCGKRRAPRRRGSGRSARRPGPRPR
jgi:hypothetical protein